MKFGPVAFVEMNETVVLWELYTHKFSCFIKTVEHTSF